MLKMKKVLSMLLVMVMMTTLLAACSSGEDKATTGSETGEKTTSTETDNKEETASIEAIETEELGSGEAKWSEEETEDGYTIVKNEGGKTIAYSKESGLALIQVEGFAFKDLNANGKLDAYEDWRQDSVTRAQDLASKLTIEQMSGLMLYSGHQFVVSKELSEDQIAFLDAGGRSMLNAAASSSSKAAAEWNNTMQAYTEADGIGIPVNTSSDPREMNVSGVPSNLALAATFDPEVVKEMGKLTSVEYRLIGITTLLGPQVDVTTEPRWNRTDGTFGDDPALSRDMTKAFVDGVQSSYDENGTDLGWGTDSMVAVVKHWPGEGAGEGGREGHSFRGNAQVFPGGMFTTQLIPFVDGAFTLDGETKSAGAVMSSYSIAYGADGSDAYGELVGTSYSEYKIKELLRDKYQFDGVVVTDWSVLDDFEAFMKGKAYGVFDLTQEERVLKALLAGVDQFGGFNDREVIVKAYDLGVAEVGEDEMKEVYEVVAARVLKSFFDVNIFENPYTNVNEAVEVVASEANQEKAFEAQLKSIVMLKNDNNALSASESDEKPTVYVPLTYVPYDMSFFGVETRSEWKLPVDIDLLSEYFEVVTDKQAETLTGDADKDGNPMASTDDIVRLTAEELADVDFALAIIEDPTNKGSYFEGFGFDTAEEQYIPISLQYGAYTADSDSVRKESISGDIVITEKDSGYGVVKVEEKENRSYFGNDSIMTNYEDLNTVKYAKETLPADKPVVVVVKSDGAMIFSEIEPYADTILIAFGKSVGSGYGIEDKALLEVAAGKSEPTGLLPVQMPADMLTVEAQLEDVPRDMTAYTDTLGNTYDFAFGMNWSGVISDDRTATYGVDAITEPSK